MPRSSARPGAATICAAAASLLCGAAAGCDSGVSLFRVLETQHFVVYREQGLPAACPAVGEGLEAYYAGFEAYLGLHRSSIRKITYKHYSTLSAAREACHGAAANCYLPETDTIVSVAAIHPHEIAHVFEGLIGGLGGAPALFAEGMASALGGGIGYDTDDHRVDTRVPLEELVGDAAFAAAVGDDGPAVIYSSAAGFMRYAIDRFGKDAFLAFYGKLDGLSHAAAIESRFMSSFGLALRDVIADWRASPQPIVEDLPIVSAECESAPEIAPGGTLDVEPACAERGFRFEVPSAGRQDLVIRGANAWVTLRACDRGDLLPSSGLVFGTSGSVVRVAIDAPAGRYAGTVTQGPVSVSVPTEPVTLDLDGTCSAGRVPAPIGGPDAKSFAIIRRWGGAEQSVAFDVRVEGEGQLQLASASNNGVLSPESTAPWVFYSCPNGCPGEPNVDCGRDDIQEIISGRDPTKEVFEAPVTPGQLLHLQTGPRVLRDWSYSLRVRVDPPPAPSP